MYMSLRFQSGAQKKRLGVNYAEKSRYCELNFEMTGHGIFGSQVILYVFLMNGLPEMLGQLVLKDTKGAVSSDVSDEKQCSE